MNAQPLEPPPTEAPPPASRLRPAHLALAGALLAALVASLLLWYQRPQSASAGSPTRITTPQHAQAILLRAKDLLREEKPREAALILQRAVDAFPEDRELRLALAEALLGIADNSAAYEQYTNAIALSDTEASTRSVAGTLASKLGMPEQSIAHYQRAQELDPTSARYPLFLAQVQRSLGQTVEAKASLLLALRIEPENTLAAGTLADMLLADNQAEQALRQVAAARLAEPDAMQWKLIEARALNRLGRSEAALLVMRSIPDPSLEIPEVRGLFSQICGKLGRHDEAAQLFARALSNDPANGTLAMETAGLFERAEDLTSAIEYAKAAEALKAPGAQAMVDRLAAALAQKPPQPPGQKPDR